MGVLLASLAGLVGLKARGVFSNVTVAAGLVAAFVANPWYQIAPTAASPAQGPRSSTGTIRVEGAAGTTDRSPAVATLDLWGTRATRVPPDLGATLCASLVGPALFPLAELGSVGSAQRATGAQSRPPLQQLSSALQGSTALRGRRRAVRAQLGTPVHILCRQAPLPLCVRRAVGAALGPVRASPAPVDTSAPSRPLAPLLWCVRLGGTARRGGRRAVRALQVATAARPALLPQPARAFARQGTTAPQAPCRQQHGRAPRDGGA